MLAADITLHELVVTPSSHCPALAACVHSAHQLLQLVTEWQDTTVIKGFLPMLLPTWRPAVRTFARQVVLLRKEGRHESARHSLTCLRSIEHALDSFSSTLVAASARRVLAECEGFFKCDPAVCVPATTSEDVAALM